MRSSLDLLSLKTITNKVKLWLHCMHNGYCREVYTLVNELLKALFVSVEFIMLLMKQLNKYAEELETGTLNVEHFLSNLNGFENFIVLYEGYTGTFSLATAQEIKRFCINLSSRDFLQ